MKPALCLLLASLVLPVTPRQEETEGRGKSAMTRFFEGEAERLTKELEGSWILLDYTDPTVPVGAGDASGFMSFHQGFATWILAVDTAEDTLFGFRSFLVLESGAYRYRVDEQANLQLASMMSFTNHTADGEVVRNSAGAAFEYSTRVEKDVLELRDSDGIVLTFRKVEAGEFPAAAGRAIEKNRSGTPAWEQTGNR